MAVSNRKFFLSCRDAATPYAFLYQALVEFRKKHGARAEQDPLCSYVLGKLDGRLAAETGKAFCVWHATLKLLNTRHVFPHVTAATQGRQGRV